MERCIVLGARRYSFKDETTAKLVEGVTLSYLTGEKEDQGDRLGMEPLTISGPAEMWTGIRELPGVYDLDFKQRPGPKNRPVLQVVGCRFVGPSTVGDELAV